MKVTVTRGILDIEKYAVRGPRSVERLQDAILVWAHRHGMIASVAVHLAMSTIEAEGRVYRITLLHARKRRPIENLAQDIERCSVKMIAGQMTIDSDDPSPNLLDREPKRDPFTGRQAATAIGRIQRGLQI
jgi:hypothetical protein